MGWWEVYIPGQGATDNDVTLKLEAPNWLGALRTGLSDLGQRPVSNIVCEVQDDNSIVVTDPQSGRVFRLREHQTRPPEAAPPPVAPPTVPTADEAETTQKNQVVAPAVTAPAEPMPPPTPAPAAAAPAAAPPAPAPARPEPEITAPARPSAAPIPETSEPTPLAATALTDEEVTDPTPAAPFAPPIAPPANPLPSAPPPSAAPLPSPAPPAPAPAPAAAPAPAPRTPPRAAAPAPPPNRKAQFHTGPVPEVRTETPPKGRQPLTPARGTGPIVDVQGLIEDIFFATQELTEQKPTPQQIAEHMLDLAMSKIPAESGTFYLAELGRPVLRFAAVRGPKAAELKNAGFTVDVGQGIVGFCAQEGVCLTIRDIEKDDRHFSKIADAIGYRPRDTACTSVERDGRLYGAIQLINSTTGKGFDGGEAEVLRYIGLAAAELIEEHHQGQGAV